MAGALVLVFVFVDALWTTMHRGGGPITRLLVGPLWTWARHTHIRALAGHRAMGALGLALVLLTVLLWILMTWGGWTLVFMGEPGAVLRADSGIAASAGERLYFVGFTVFTLGIGDYHPADDVFWQVLTIVASFTGFGLITFVVTYLMPVVGHAVSKRAFASELTSLGASPAEIVARAGQRGSLERLESVLERTITQVVALEQAHDAYPVLHFFHDVHPNESVAVGLARFDEAVRIASHGVAGERACHPLLCHQWNTVLERFLDTMQPGRDDPEPPPPPSRERLLADGLPVVDDDAYARAYHADGERRRALLAFVRGHGWEWGDVTGESATGEATRLDPVARPAE